MFSSKIKEAQRQYRLFVKEGMNAGSPFDNVKEGILLGSPQFVDWIWEKTNGSEEIKEIPRSERIVGRPTLKELFEEVKDRKERDAMIVFASNRCGYLISEIANYLRLDASTTGKIAQ